MSSAASPLRLCLLGPPRIELRGTALRFDTRKALGLLAYLAISRQTFQRQALALVFWPDASEQRARAALRRTLSALNRPLERRALQLSRGTVGLSPQLRYELDVDSFHDLIRGCESHAHSSLADCEACLAKLAQAVKLARSPLMDGFSLPGSRSFTAWLRFQRAELHDARCHALRALVDAYECRDELAEAERLARLLLAEVPLDEALHRQLMRLCGRRRRWAEGQKLYRSLLDRLQKVLRCAPQPQTQQLYAQLMRRELPPGPEGTPALNRRSSAADLQSGAPPGLPAQLTPLIGRQRERSVAGKRLLRPDCRLLTLAGPGGIGKTRLALAVAADLAGKLADGVGFVPLAGVDDAGGLEAGIASSLGLPFEEADLAQRLVDSLRSKQILLVLDNFEQLSHASERLNTLLCECPRLKLLVTSRVRLCLEAEQLLVVDGLPCEADAAANEALQLFLGCAARVRPELKADGSASEAMLQICRRLAGWPLALELAASWLSLLSPAATLARLEAQGSLPEGCPQDLPLAQGGLRSVFETSWQLLSPALRTGFARLSVFRGGFSRRAGSEITGLSLSSLLALCDCFLVQRRGTRFSIHPLLRRYASAKLEPKDAEALRHRHAQWYGELLEDACPRLWSAAQAALLERLRRERDNTCAAWQHAVQTGRLAWLDRSLDALCESLLLQGELRQGLRLCALACEGLRSVPASARLRARLLARQGMFARRLELEQAEPLLREALAGAADDLRERAYCQAQLGQLLAARAAPEPAREALQASLAAADTLGDQLGRVRVLGHLGELARQQGNYAECLRWQRQSLAAAEGLEIPWLRAHLLNDLGMGAGAGGRFEEAAAHFDQALELFRRVGARAGEAAALQNKSSLRYLAGDFPGCLELRRDCLAICRELGHRARLARALTSLGQVEAKLGQTDQARAHLGESLALARQLDNGPGQLAALSALAGLSARLGEVGEARGQLRELARLLQLHPLARYGLHALVLAADVLLAENQPVRARQALHEAALHPAAEAQTQRLACERLAELGETAPEPEGAEPPPWQQLVTRFVAGEETL